MFKSLAVIVLGFTLVLVSPARADRAGLAAGRVSIEVPAGWTVQSTANTLAITAADNTLGIVLAAASDADREQTWTRVVTGAKGQVADLALGTRGEGRVGGMVALLATGRGTTRGTSVSMVLGVITTPAGNHVALMVTSDTPRGKVHAAELQAALDSITPTAEPATELSAGAAAFATKVTTAIDGNDGKHFVALLAARFTRAGKVVKPAAVKKALARWPAAKGGLAGYLGQPPGDWHVLALGDAMLTLRRGGDDTEAVELIVVQQVKGTWRVTGTTAGHAIAEPPTGR